MAQTLGRVYYRNVLRRPATTTYSGAQSPGFESINAYDWRDFSVFRPAEGNSYIEALPVDPESVSSLVFWLANGPGTIDAVRVQREATPGNWATVDTFVPAVGINLRSFAAASSDGWRVLFDGVVGVLNIRQIFLGSPLEFPRGQHTGIRPPTLLSGVVTDNVIAINGSILGRSRRRVERAGEIDLANLGASWVRSTWEPFAEHMVRWPCFWQWAPALYPQEVVLAAAENIVAPENTMPVPTMAVRMPLRCVSGDQEIVPEPTPECPDCPVCPEDDAVASVMSETIGFHASVIGGTTSVEIEP